MTLYKVTRLRRSEAGFITKKLVALFADELDAREYANLFVADVIDPEVTPFYFGEEIRS